MTEKEINNNQVSGKKLEDLSKEELEKIQGQGDTNSETLPITTAALTTTVVAITKRPFCKK